MWIEPALPGSLLFSRIWLFVTPWTMSHQASLFFEVSWNLLRFLSVELVMLFESVGSLDPSLLYGPTLRSILTRWTFVGKVMSLFFNTLSSFVIAFLPRSKCLWISWLQSLSALILEPRKIKSVTVSNFPFCLPWSDGTGCHDLCFECWVLSQLFHSPFTLIKVL